MENQIKKCLLSLRKISNIPAECQIDTTRGDIDVYVPTYVNMMRRQIWDGRLHMIQLFREKYTEVKEITTYIMESGKYIMSLKIIHHRLVSSKEGLMMIKRSQRYMDDMEIKNNIEHILEDEIPQQLTEIERFLERKGMTVGPLVEATEEIVE